MGNLSFLGVALLAASAHAGPHKYFQRGYNSSLTSVEAEDSSTSSASFLTSSSIASTNSSTSSQASTTSSTLALSSLTGSSALSGSLSTDSTSTVTTPATRPRPSYGASNSTSRASTNSSTSTASVCGGCVLEAINPITTWFDESIPANGVVWSSVVVTETILYQITEYYDTTVTNSITVNQTKTIVGTLNQTIVHSTPTFTWEIAHHATLTLDAGPTYVAYLDLFGGLDFNPLAPETTGTDAMRILPLPTGESPVSCFNDVLNIDVAPKRTEDYTYLIQTFTDAIPESPRGSDMFVPLPSPVLEWLRQNPAIQETFGSSDIATCTQRPIPVYETIGWPVESHSSVILTTPKMFTSLPSPVHTIEVPPPPPESEAPSSSTPPPAYYSQPPRTTATSVYISTTYASTSTHLTVRDCLRKEMCSSNYEPGNPGNPGKSTERPMLPESIPDPRPTNQRPPPGATDKPRPNSYDPGHPGGQTVSIGDTAVVIRPPRPTGNNPQDPDGYHGIEFGSTTLTPGQVITTDGVIVSVPSSGGIVVDGSTISVNSNPGPTGPPVLTVGDHTVTANSQGQFVVGSQTLRPGGPAITTDGTTLSLGPSGTIAVVNGVTQTLQNVPTGPVAITVGDRTVQPTVIGGTTMFEVSSGKTLRPGTSVVVDGTTFSLPEDKPGSIVINGKTTKLTDDIPFVTLNRESVTAEVESGTTHFVLGTHTLTPGGTVTYDGTTFSMPEDGTIVINGKTTTFDGTALPVLTLTGESIVATVSDGTTALVLGPGATLTPGGEVTVSGTVYSMPASASGSVVIIDGTSVTLGHAMTTAAPALTIDGTTYVAQTRDGTVEYRLGDGKTLRPGSSIVSDGTTFSLDPEGTALIINDKTSSIPKSTPAHNSATTTDHSARSTSAATTRERAPGNFIASGIGETQKEGAAVGRTHGLDKWAEGAVIGAAGWLLLAL